MTVIILIINWLFRILTVGLFTYILICYFVSAYNPIRRFLSKIFDPMLRLLQKVLPPVGGFDFSPVVLMLILWLLNYLIIQLLSLVH